MVKVIPAIIPHTYQDLYDKMNVVKRHVDVVQVDVMDGQYAPLPSWPYGEDRSHFMEIVAQTEGFPHWRELNYQVDMMVQHPETHIESWVQAGADSCIIHVESTTKHRDIFTQLQNSGVGIGLATKPSTDAKQLLEWIDYCDFVQFMGNDKIGYHGVELDKKVLGKIRDVRDWYPELIIAVDIGVNFDTAPDLVAAGANCLVSGSAIFNSDDIAGAITKLQRIDE